MGRREVVWTVVFFNICCLVQCCSKPDLPKNGYLSNERDTYNVNDQVTLLCREGYTPNGQNFTKCLPNGLWDQQLPLCEKDLAYSKMTKILILDDVEMIYREWDSTEKLTDGNFSNCVQFSLQQNNIRLEIDLENVFYISSIAIGLGIEGMDVQMRIGVSDTTNGNEGKEEICWDLTSNIPSRELNLKCNKRGNIVSIYLPQSNNPMSICKIQVLEANKAIQGCPKPELPKNGYLTVDQKVYNAGSSVTMLCEEGYAPIGQNSANCLYDGSWDLPLPLCLKDVVFKKPVKIQVWDDTIKDLTQESVLILTDEYIDTCSPVHSGTDHYLEIDLEHIFDIDHILLGFGRQETQVDMEIRIVDTTDYSQRQCGKLTTTLKSRGIIVPCRMDESNHSVGLKGNKLSIRLSTSDKEVSLCKIQAFSIGQVHIEVDGSDESYKMKSDQEETKSTPTVHFNPSLKSDPKRDDHLTVERGFTIDDISLVLIIISVVLFILISLIISVWKLRQHCRYSGHQPLQET